MSSIRYIAVTAFVIALVASSAAASTSRRENTASAKTSEETSAGQRALEELSHTPDTRERDGKPDSDTPEGRWFGWFGWGHKYPYYYSYSYPHYNYYSNYWDSLLRRWFSRWWFLQFLLQVRERRDQRRDEVQTGLTARSARQTGHAKTDGCSETGSCFDVLGVARRHAQRNKRSAQRGCSG